MARVQLALNVSSLDEAISFYSNLFGVGPAKVRPGYANFAIDEPPLKLVLIEGAGSPGSINHLGVEVGTSAEVGAATKRLDSVGLETLVEEEATCCFAVQDKVWVTGPDEERWEVYVVLEDAEEMVPAATATACCGSETASTGLSITASPSAPSCC